MHNNATEPSNLTTDTNVRYSGAYKNRTSPFAKF